MIKKIEIGEILSAREARAKFAKLKSDKINIIIKRGKVFSALISINMLNEFIGDEKFKELLFEIYIREETEKRINKAAKKQNLETLTARQVIEESKKKK